MTTFTIDTENSIAALAAEQAPDGAAPFTSEKDLLRLAAEWPAERLVEIWNGIPGVKPVTRFTSRKTAAGRIWKAIQSLAPDGQPAASAKGTKPAKAAKPAKQAKPAKKAAKKAKGGERANKKAEVIAMMKRAGGATLGEIMKATGWQKHTVRGFVSILGSKGGEKIESSKSASGERTYKIAK